MFASLRKLSDLRESLGLAKVFGRGNVGDAELYKLRFAKRTSGRYPAHDFLERLKTLDRDFFDKFHRAFEKFVEHGPDGVTGLYKALQGQGGIVQFTIWKYRILGFRVGNEVFVSNGFKKDQDETPPVEIQRAKDMRAEHQQPAGGGQE